MPSWSIRYQGALDDQQINDIVNYLVDMSSKNVPFEDNVCINPDAVKAVNSPSASPAAATGATGATRRRRARRACERRDGCDRSGRLMLAQQVHTCLGFHIDCGTLFKGAGVIVMAFILFVGSVYLMLSSVFGKWMGYLVLAVCFSGWLIIHSSLWFFGFWAQGPGTPTNQGPRGQEPSWVVLEAGLSAVGRACSRSSRSIPATGGRRPNDGTARVRSNR